MHQPAYTIIMVANVLVPSGCQAISNHHADLTFTMVSYESYGKICIVLQPLNIKLCSREISNLSVCYWWILLLMLTTHYVTKMIILYICDVKQQFWGAYLLSLNPQTRDVYSAVCQMHPTDVSCPLTAQFSENIQYTCTYILILQEWTPNQDHIFINP